MLLLSTIRKSYTERARSGPLHLILVALRLKVRGMITEILKTNTHHRNSRRNSLVDSVLGFCVIFHCAFSVKVLLLAHGFKSLLSQILTKFCLLFSVHSSIGKNIPHSAAVYCGPLQQRNALLNGKFGSAGHPVQSDEKKGDYSFFSLPFLNRPEGKYFFRIYMPHVHIG